MSNGNNSGGGGGATGIDQTISISGLPDFTVNVTDIAPPDMPTDLPRAQLEKYFRDCYTMLHTWGCPKWIAAAVAGTIVGLCGALVVMKDLLIVILRVVLPPFGGEVLQALDDLRKSVDPEVADLAVDVLNELLGTDVTASDMPTGTTTGDHLARADKVGGILHDMLMSEFTGMSSITPETGRAAARRFSGLMINFGTVTGVLATLGGLIPQIHLDDVREIGEQVAQNLGLGRLGRQVLRPIVQTLIEMPYTWWIHQQYRPTQLTVSDCVNPYTGAVIDPALIHSSLALQGYSDTLISAIIELHQKKLTEADYWLLVEQKLKADTDFESYLQKLGYSADDAADRALAETYRAEKALQDEIISASMDAYVAGHIALDEFQGIVNTARPHPDLNALTMLLAQYKAKVPHKALTLAEITSMLEMDVINTGEFEDYLTAFGYSEMDALNLKIWTLLKLAQKEEAAKAKAAKAAAKTTIAAAPTTSSSSSAPSSSGSMGS
jgi:hypothetical protein